MATTTPTTARRRRQAERAENAPNRDEVRRQEGRRELHLKLKSWFQTEMVRQQANRYQMALDEDYYDSIHYTPQEAAKIRARGQQPIVFNEVKPSIDFLIGTERRMRRDFKILARRNRDEAATKDAETKTQLLKYLDDVGKVPFQRSQVADDAWKAGMGVMFVGLNDDPEQEIILRRKVSWRNVMADSLRSDRTDINTGRYFFEFQEVDLDVAQAIFSSPEQRAALDRAAQAFDSSGVRADWVNGYPIQGYMGSNGLPARWMQYDSEAWAINPRKRVLLIAAWWYDYSSSTSRPGETGELTANRTSRRVRCTIMTEEDVLLDAPSPYQHNRYPYVIQWAYLRKKDGAPYGPIRPVRDVQDDINKKMAKASFATSVNQLRIEEGAISPEMPLEELRDEVAAPDGIAVFANGALAGGRVQVREQGEVAQSSVALMERQVGFLRGTMGVNEELRGMQGSATSRVAMDAKAERGGVITAELFDNVMLAHQCEGELVLSLVEQFYTENMVFSVTGERFALDYYEINGTGPNGERINDVTAHKAQFVIGDAPWRQALAAAAFESAMDMLGKLGAALPQVVTAIIDLVFEWSDLPNKQLIVQRIRQATGATDPDKGDSPEQQAIKQRQQQVAQAEFEAQMAGLQASIKEAQAKGEKLDAEAIAKRLEGLYMAAQAAQVLASVPQIAPVADELLASVGFQDRAGGAGPALDVPMPAAPGGAPAAAAIPQAQQADGAMAGIETPAADGVIPPQPQPAQGA